VLVSVIIPAFNAEKYISETIDSVLNQSFRSFEIIVVDDGSTDRTADIVRQFGNHVKYIRQENSGPSKARNTGIRHASGEYIAFLDADDLWTERKLELQVGFLESHSDVGMVFADMMVFNEERLLKESSLRTKGNHFYETLVAERDGFHDPFLRLIKTNFIPTGSVVLRKSCLEKVGLFDETLSSAEDRDMWMRISILCKIGFVPQVLMRRRVHNQNISKDLFKDVRSTIFVMKKLLLQFPEFTKAYRRSFDESLAELYFGEGYGLFSRGDLKKARSSFWNSLRHRWFAKTGFYTIACYLPMPVISLIRKLKHLLIHGPNGTGLISVNR
jgi:glycosyltransferase involved in cell wall biosynthesis